MDCRLSSIDSGPLTKLPTSFRRSVAEEVCLLPVGRAGIFHKLDIQTTTDSPGNCLICRKDSSEVHLPTCTMDLFIEVPVGKEIQSSIRFDGYKIPLRSQYLSGKTHMYQI